jgi:hypothetical protein
MDTTQGGKTMKRLIAGILAVAVLAAVVLTIPQPAEARGNFWGGFAAGAVTGVVVGGVLAPRPVYVGPPVVYGPAPVYVAPSPVVAQPAPVYAAPGPVCSTYWVNGYWYGYNWVAGHWEQACR